MSAARPSACWIGAWALLAAGSAAASPAPGPPSLAPCATPLLLPGFAPPRPFPPLAPGARDKTSLNPYGVPNELVSDDFVVRWGGDWVPNQPGLQTLSTALQDAWATQIDAMGHPAPPSSDSTRINVYIGDTGGGTPSSFGAGGYFTPDAEGYPILVVNPASLDEPAWTRVVALHEFYHSVQWGLDTYSYEEDSPGAWYWEATASWIPSITDPSSPANGSFLYGFALLPHLELDAFDYPDQGTLAEYHQYGAFIFPTWIAEAYDGASLIRDSWVAPVGGTNDPIEALRGGLAGVGIDFDEAFTDFVAANVFWDYVLGDSWAQYVAAGQAAFPSESPTVAWVDAGGTDGFVAPPTSRTPRRYGANVVRLDDLADGSWLLRAEFDAQGSQGSAAQWGATLVRSQGGLGYQRLSAEELALGVPIEPGGQLALAVAAWSTVRRTGERFDWRWSVTSLDPGDDDDLADDDDASDDDDLVNDDDDDGFGGSGCRCEASSAPAPGTAMLLALLYGMATPLARRRWAASARSVPSGNSAAKSP